MRDTPPAGAGPVPRLVIANPNPAGLSCILCNLNEEGWRIWKGEHELPHRGLLRTVTAFAQAFESSGCSDSAVVTRRSE